MCRTGQGKVAAPCGKPLIVILSEAKNLLHPAPNRFFGLRPQNDIAAFSVGAAPRGRPRTDMQTGTSGTGNPSPTGRCAAPGQQKRRGLPQGCGAPVFQRMNIELGWFHHTRPLFFPQAPVGDVFSEIYRSSFRSSSLIQPFFRMISQKTQDSTAGRTKLMRTRPTQSMAVMAAFVPAATSLTQPV